MYQKSKTKRMSLDPANKVFHYSSLKNNRATELEMRQNPRDQSQSTISNHEQYSAEDLQKIFTAISQGSDRIVVSHLYQLLQQEGYSENKYSAVQMIALVDENRKGYVTKQQFLKFFLNKQYIDEEKVPPLPKGMASVRSWVQAIDQNWEMFKDLADKNYCTFVAKKVKESLGMGRPKLE